MVMASGRWLGVRLDLLASMLIGTVSLAAVLVSQDAGRCICKVNQNRPKTPIRNLRISHYETTLASFGKADQYIYSISFCCLSLSLMEVYRTDVPRLPFRFKLRHGQFTLVKDNLGLQMEQPLITFYRSIFRSLAKCSSAWNGICVTP